MGTKVRRVGVDVHTAVTVGFRFPSRHPLAVHILPAVTISRAEVQEEGVHGVGVQTRHAHLQYREHPPGGKRRWWCVCVCARTTIQHENDSYCHAQTQIYTLAKNSNKAQNIISSIQRLIHKMAITVICINFKRALQTGHFAHFFFFFLHDCFFGQKCL